MEKVTHEGNVLSTNTLEVAARHEKERLRSVPSKNRQGGKNTDVAPLLRTSLGKAGSEGLASHLSPAQPGTECGPGGGMGDLSQQVRIFWGLNLFLTQNTVVPRRM